MLAVERRKIILERANEEKKVIVSELSREFDVSEETIRRDLERLEEEGHITRTYGGAVINEKSSIDLPFNLQWKANATGKKVIAELIEEEIQDGDHIFLDASTTAVFIAKNIKNKRKLTIITNSIEILLELSDVEGWDIIGIGGVFRPASVSLVGNKAADNIQCYNADKLIFSCKGFDPEKGVTDGNDETCAVKQKMLAASSRIYLAVDSGKFDKVAFSKICGLSEIHVVVTDQKPAARWLEEFRKLNIRCLYPRGPKGEKNE